MNEAKKPTTLGQYLEQGRQEAGLSLRQLSAASGVNLMTIRRILHDEVESPSAEHVQHLVHTLELDEADAFAFIGVTPPKGLPSVAPYLRQKHGLKGDALSEATDQIQKIIEKYNGAP
ncbi:helix-turn-helix domain-containing protein [Actinokineospora enzanensis]|uniref:helix-turn-helix domain-containing protein n=1 Tax=Actinokineospora enzanensis TaxID=155975 RepID=UPI0009FECB62|nr:helix-turn-helix domain-containing protein [Actinokineospora enzanensis]